MPAIDIPGLGTVALCATLAVSGFALAASLGAARGDRRLLVSARYAAYVSVAFTAVAVCLLAYAFQTHDFRIRYVARYSDRSMPWWFLVSSLWGGQDGSLLWWAFLLSGWTAVCVRWMRGKYLELQPAVIATLMVVQVFFQVVMLFAANPFATSVSAPPTDGEGLNPLLQNYWMVIHPPCLYMGYVGWVVPFAFVVAALVTGRLREEWILAIRRWAIMAWLFLALGNLLGALWSYEELGWGGYWAWDPVENAALMPLLVGTAYLHSVMIQERYGMLKVWNVFLLCLTFIMTIFGTFLTRSGLIASVHSFARSDIGVYFLWFIVVLVVACAALMVWRLPLLRGEYRIASMASREFVFLLQNWSALAMMLFVLVATTFPLLSEWIRGEEVTVGPAFYNKWMVPLGLVFLFLMGVGPLISWRKATGKNLRRAFVKPAIAGLAVAALHVTVGRSLGFAPFVESEEIYDTVTGKVLAAMFGVAPVFSFALCTFVLGTIFQEFWRATAVRMKGHGENPLLACGRIVSRARRRYGGYIVHVGVVLMYVGFTGAAYDEEREAALRPGSALEIGDYSVRFDGARMESDASKQMVLADLTVRRGGEDVGRATPAKFIYRSHPEMPTTEVSIHRTLREDVYTIMSTVDPESKLGTFKVIVRPLVNWIWIGTLVLILGTVICVFPTVRELLGEETERARGERTRRGGLAMAGAALLIALVALYPLVASAQSDSSSTLHAGTAVMRSPEERQLFERLLCMCGDCQRLSLATCACGWADNMRDELRVELSAGRAPSAIQESYRERFGAKALAVPADEGLDRALWAVPLAAIALAGGGLLYLGRRWRRRGLASTGRAVPTTADPATPPHAPDPYDARLDAELAKLEGR